MRPVLVEPCERRHLQALVGADEQLDRADRGLDRPEPQAFGLALGAAELARRIDLDLDAVVRGLFQLGLVDLDVFVLHVVERLGRELHGEVLRPRRHASQHDAGRYGQARNQEAPSPARHIGSMIGHVVPPSVLCRVLSFLPRHYSVPPVEFNGQPVARSPATSTG